MRARSWIPLFLGLALLVSIPACDPGARDGADGGEAGDVEVDPGLGTLTVMNATNEPVGIHLEGQELYAVPPGRSFTFRNLPTREVDIYGVGRISQRHYGLPRLTIEEGGEYEWTIRP